MRTNLHYYRNQDVRLCEGENSNLKNTHLGGRITTSGMIASTKNAGPSTGILAFNTTMLVSQRPQPGESFTALVGIELRIQAEHRHPLLDDLLDDIDERPDLGELPSVDHACEPGVAFPLERVREPNVIPDAHPFYAVRERAFGESGAGGPPRTDDCKITVHVVWRMAKAPEIDGVDDELAEGGETRQVFPEGFENGVVRRDAKRVDIRDTENEYVREG